MNFDEIKKHYREKLKLFGQTAEGMDWKDKETQYLRFERIAKFIEFESNPSILDVGCGLCEFLNYCIIGNFKCNYKGLDVLQEMVDYSNQRYGKEIAVLGDLDSIGNENIFNYVIASGTFNVKLSANDQEWKTFFYKSLKKMFDKCNKGIVFNCMTEHVDWKYDRLYYPNISDLTKFITTDLSKNFVIDHSYDLFEMTIYIPK